MNPLLQELIEKYPDVDDRAIAYFELKLKEDMSPDIREWLEKQLEQMKAMRHNLD